MICLYLLGTIVFEMAQVRNLWLLQSATRCLLLGSEISKRSEAGHISPESTTGIFSKGTYWWLNRLFMGAFRANLSLDDLYPLDEELSSKFLASRHDQRWENNKGDCYKILIRYTLRLSGSSRRYVRSTSVAKVRNTRGYSRT
jgi:hypothetical protein